MEQKREFQSIYRNYHDKIRRYVERLIGDQEAEDVTQEVLLKINGALE